MGFIEEIARQLLEKKMRPGTGHPQGTDTEETIVLSPETARDGGPFAYHHKARDKKLVVKIPPGTREGQRIRLAGMGRPSLAGNPRGIFT